MLRSALSKEYESKLSFWLIRSLLLFLVIISFHALRGQPANCSDLTLVGTIENATCASADGVITVNIGGGIPPYSYQWSNGISASAISGLSIGSYITIEAKATQPNQSYRYSYTNGASHSLLSGIPAGSYTLTVVDANGCKVTKSYQIGQDQTPFIIDANIVNTSCTSNTGAISLTVNGGVEPYEYLWSNGATTKDISGLAAGNYLVIITDRNGCTEQPIFKVGVQPGEGSFEVQAEVIDASCNGNDGAINLTMAEPGNYTFEWSNNATSQNLSNLSGGTYTVSIANEFQCSIQRSFTINVTPGPVKPTITQSSDTLISDGDGQYQWYKNGTLIEGATQAQLIISETNYYYVVISNADGCSATSDSYDVEYTEPTTQSREINQNIIIKADIYPNPVQSKLNVKIKASQPAISIIEIYNLQGNLVYFEEFSESKNQFVRQLDLSSLPSGIYVVKVNVENEYVTRNLIKR